MEQFLLIICSALTMILLVMLTCILMYFTCKLKMKYKVLKIIIRTLFFWDFWYICWLYKWFLSNRLAIWSIPAMICLVFVISQLSGLLYSKEILKRTTEIIILTPILWASLTGLIYHLLNKSYKYIG